MTSFTFMLNLRSASSHPNMKRKHVRMFAGDDLVTSLNDEPKLPVVKPAARIILRWPRPFFGDGVCPNHLARNQIVPDTEVFKRPLRLRSPKLCSRNIGLAQAVSLFSKACGRDIANSTHF